MGDEALFDALSYLDSTWISTLFKIIVEKRKKITLGVK